MSEFLETAKNVIKHTTPLAEDVCEVSEAIFTDFIQKKKKRPGKRTVRAVASVTWGVAAAEAGGFVGGAIGAAFGGVGAVPGAFIGEVVGGTLGSIGGSTAAKAVVNECVSSDSEDSD